MVRRTDRPAMTIAVDLGRKATKQTNKQTNKQMKSEEASCSKSLRCGIYHANKCSNAISCWHFNIYEQDTSCSQLS